MSEQASRVKSWKSMSEQLALLTTRGLQVDNEAAALDYLARIGYYRLSGYWYPLREPIKNQSLRQKLPARTDQFIPGSHFEDVANLYIFDKKLRLLALDALERIEMAIRVDIAHLLGEREPIAHENPDCLHGNFTKKVITSGPNKGKTEHQIWLEKYKGLLKRAKNESFVKHHNDTYGGLLPIWVAIEVWDFGLLSRLFSGMKHNDKNEIAKKYRLPDGPTLAKWLRSLNFIRNVSAHHSRLWNINIVELTDKPSSWPEMKESKPFMYFAMMVHLLAVICPKSTWTERLLTLLRAFPRSRNGVLNISDFGTCQDWEQWLLQLKK